MTYSPSDIQRTLTLSKFRVKIKSLAEEAKIIRHEENRYKTHEVEHYVGPFVPNRDPRPKTTKTSLASQLTLPGMQAAVTPVGAYRTKKKIIKTYEHNDFIRQQLREHRVKDLRTETLYTLLAYAFYRNKSIQSVLLTANTTTIAKIDRSRIMQMVERMQGDRLLRSEVDRFNQWAVEGKLPHQAGRVAYI